MINVAVVGASGYTGLELIKIIVEHPIFNLAYVANSTGDTTTEELHPSLKGVVDLVVKKADSKEISKNCQLAFLALPHKTSMGFAKELLSLGVKVVDLSADYRLELETYEEWYCPHEDRSNLEKAVYGMPELFRKDIENADLIANPGCYPTATILPLLPFLDYIDNTSTIYIDAKSGVGGAGKGLSDNVHYGYMNENMYAYKPFNHRHMPEIKEKLKLKSGKDLNILFVPHLIPSTRGMLISIYLKLNKEIKNPMELIEEFYKDEPFIRTRDKPVDLKSISGTNFCDIFAITDSKDLFISCSIDNLLKGASSAAVVNANLMFALKEDLGIPKIAYCP